jgi:hypothetical protein
MLTKTHRAKVIRSAVLFGLLITMSSAGTAQQRTPSARSPQALSPMDYIEIQQLVARYGYALDSGAPEGTGGDYAGLFTADGEFVGPGIPDNTQGREKLGSLARIQPGGRRGPTYVSHFLMNHLIEPSPDGAKGTVYLLVINFGENGKASSLSMGGHYDDVYVRTADGWRFKRRQFERGKVSLPPPQGEIAPAAVMRPLSDQPKNQKGSTLTALDYIEIRKLVAGYAYGLDTGADNAYQYADLFASDAVLFGRTTGRENIANLARREPHGPQYVRHFLTNVLIEPSPTGATGKQYLAVIDIGEGGMPSSIFLGGRYEDEYVKTPQGWRFKSRNLVRAKAAAQ